MKTFIFKFWLTWAEDSNGRFLIEICPFVRRCCRGCRYHRKVFSTLPFLEPQDQLQPNLAKNKNKKIKILNAGDSSFFFNEESKPLLKGDNNWVTKIKQLHFKTMCPILSKLTQSILESWGFACINQMKGHAFWCRRIPKTMTIFENILIGSIHMELAQNNSKCSFQLVRFWSIHALLHITFLTF